MLLWAGVATAQTAYSNDFQTTTAGFSSSVGVSLMHTGVDCTSIRICIGGQGSVLGNGASEPFTNDAVLLSLSDLPQHTDITLSFYLLILHTWDGNDPGNGPDQFKITGPNGEVLLHSTFANIIGFPQSYPGNYPTGSYPTYTGAVEVGTLGTHWIPGWEEFMSSVYEVSLTISHTGSTANFTFEGLGLGYQIEDGTKVGYWPDEGWSLDNVVVMVENQATTVPEPGTYLLVAIGLFGIYAFRRTAVACKYAQQQV